MLEGLLPRLLPDTVVFHIIAFEGKNDLDKQLPRKIRAWLSPDTQFVVLRDQDVADCKAIKERLVSRCAEAGRPDTLVRVVCRTLESWYIGDLDAVGKAFDIQVAHHANKAKYRVPDAVHSPDRELRTLTKNAYQKIGGSRAVGKHMDPPRNRSHSFRIFVSGLERLLSS